MVDHKITSPRFLGIEKTFKQKRILIKGWVVGFSTGRSLILEFKGHALNS